MTTLLQELYEVVVDGNVCDRASFLTIHAPKIRAALELQAKVKLIIAGLRAEAACAPNGYTFGQQAACNRAGELADALERELNAAPPAGKEEPA